MTTKLIVTAGFLVAFAAGLVTGLQTRRDVVPAGPGPTTQPREHSRRGPGMIEEALGLSSEQREKMKQIWSDFARHGREEQSRLRAQYRKERDDAIAALIRPEDMAAYDQILRDYNAKIEALEQESRRAFEERVRLTNQILTPEQRTKYAELRKRWDRGPGSAGGPRGRGDRDRSEEKDNQRWIGERATTEPSPQP
ncbi:Spy/CpxP family protein refolding chaperone [Fontivita pretiosa]|uniref:Spy/CpxP family protein refolding chaperone n=1 Tax=Fontivita pretiosa TaxID=2989684 RepID=UPI003D16C090